MLPGDTLCKLAQIFPPKVLVYTTRKISLTTFLIYLIESKWLKRIWDENFGGLLSINYKTIKNWSLYFIDLLSMVIIQVDKNLVY